MSSKYHQLAEKCINLQVSVSCLVQIIDFNQMDSIMQVMCNGVKRKQKFKSDYQAP